MLTQADKMEDNCNPSDVNKPPPIPCGEARDWNAATDAPARSCLSKYIATAGLMPP